MKYLVTGGAGFIGSNYIYYMLEEHPEDQVVCLDLLTYAGHLKTLNEAMKNKKFKFVQGDIADYQFVENLFEQEKFDVVVNFAAETHVDRSITDPNVFIRTNVLGTQVLLNACRKFKIARYHQVSTDEVYGDLPLDKPELLFSESSPIQPSSPYSAAKASADLLCLSYHRTFDMPVTISRCSNNYGRFQFPEKLIPLMIIKALHEEKLPVYGEGMNVRDWLHVWDHCKAIDLIVQNGKIGEVYNIGGHNEKTNIEVVKIILQQLGKSEDLISYVADRLGHDLRYAIDPSKMQKELHWKPVYTFETGIQETIQWYLDHPEWWQELI